MLLSDSSLCNCFRFGTLTVDGGIRNVDRMWPLSSDCSFFITSVSSLYIWIECKYTRETPFLYYIMNIFQSLAFIFIYVTLYNFIRMIIREFLSKFGWMMASRTEHQCCHSINGLNYESMLRTSVCIRKRALKSSAHSILLFYMDFSTHNALILFTQRAPPAKNPPQTEENVCVFELIIFEETKNVPKNKISWK